MQSFSRSADCGDETPVSQRCDHEAMVQLRVMQEADWPAVAAIFRSAIATGMTTFEPENAVSLALHESCGFRLVGRRERLDRLGGQWRDVLLLERRSALL